MAQGSWADILWVDANLGELVDFDSFTVLGHQAERCLWWLRFG